MDPTLAKRFATRMAGLLPFLVALFGYRIYQDVQRGESLSKILVLNGVPILLLGALSTGLLWFLGRPVAGVADAQVAVELRRASLMRKAAVASLLVNATLAAGLIYAASR